MRLSDLKVISKGLDEGDKKGAINLGLRLGRDESIVCEAVVFVDLERGASVFEVELVPGEEAEVVFKNFQIH